MRLLFRQQAPAKRICPHSTCANISRIACCTSPSRNRFSKKAQESYQKVLRCTDNELRLFSGTSKEHDRKYVFATVQTMSRPEVLTQFSKDDFDYILIDEVHHAAVDSYKRIIGNYCLRCFLPLIIVFSSAILLFPHWIIRISRVRIVLVLAILLWSACMMMDHTF